MEELKPVPAREMLHQKKFGPFYGDEKQCGRCGGRMYFGVNGSWNHKGGGGSGYCQAAASIKLLWEANRGY